MSKRGVLDMIHIEPLICKRVLFPYNGYNAALEVFNDNEFITFYRWEQKPCYSPFYIEYGFLLESGEISVKDSIFKSLHSGAPYYNPKIDYTHVEYDPKLIRWQDDYVLTTVKNQYYCSRHVTIDSNKNVFFSNSTMFRGMNFKLAGQEKNWMPFVYKDLLYMVYSIQPHIVLRFRNSGWVEKLYETPFSFEWAWGRLSGGTQAVKLPTGEYLAFFHSFLSDKRGDFRTPRQYYAGAYCFEANPPFRITKITPEPLIWNGLYNVISDSPHKVVFPSGLVLKNDLLYMMYGENDIASFLMTIPFQSVLNTMKAI